MCGQILSLTLVQDLSAALAYKTPKMLPLYTSIVLLPALIVNAGVVTEQPTFWYPNPGASCGHINVAAADNDAFIGVCAVISSSARVYGCPANQKYGTPKSHVEL